MTELHFKIVFGVLWVVYGLIRSPHTKKYKEVAKKNIVGETREKVLLGLIMLAMGLLPWFWIFSSWFSSFDMNLPIEVRYAGIALSLFSLWFFWLVHKTLGLNWSPALEIREEHTLVKAGPYKRIRHPMYTQIWLWSIASLLIISNWIVGGAGLVVWAIAYFTRVPHEEKMMMDEFGEQYEQYKKETWRIFPKP